MTTTEEAIEAKTQVIAATTEAITADTSNTESTSAPSLPPPRKRRGRPPRLTSNNAGNLAHSNTTTRTKPVFKKRMKAALKKATAVDAAENIEGKDDARLATQERPVRERPSRTAAKIANAAWQRAFRDTTESLNTSEAPVKPFREPPAFLHERLRPFGSYDDVPPQEHITLTQRKAVNQHLKKIIQQDPKTGEIHYVCPKPLRGCTYHQKMVLEAAFNARKTMLIDHHRTKSSKLPLQEGDYGFVSVLAQCTSYQVKAYFTLRADIEARLLERDIIETTDININATPCSKANAHKGCSNLHFMELYYSKRRETGKATDRKRHHIQIQHEIETEDHKVPSTGTTPEEDAHTDDGDGCSPITPKDTHQFIKLEEEEPPVAPSWSRNRCLTNSSDMDYVRSRLENETVLKGDDSAYILAHIAHQAKPLLGSELEYAEASQDQRHVPHLQDYISTSSPKPHLCSYCRASIFSARFMCRLCTKGFCTDCYASPKVLKASLCDNDQGHRQKMLQFCGRYPAATLESFVERLDQAYATLPDRLKNLSQERRDAQREARHGESEVG
ncbi:hypothetical protein BG000_006036, partial [Podila horticola]